MSEAAAAVAQRRSVVESADQQHLANIGKKETKRDATVHPSRMRLAEYDRQDWVVDVEPGHTIDDLKNPAYWAHMAQQLSPFDHIEARAEDGSWVADLIVLQAERTWARVVIKGVYKFEDVATVESVYQHTVEWKGPRLRYCVVRKSDREVVKDCFNSKPEAEAWMVEHEKVTLGT